MDIKLSVVIPTHNAAQYIPAAVKAVIGQTVAPHEIIIINNGSTDETPVVLETCIRQYPDANIVSFAQENHGVSGSRNRGIEEASGEYVCFLDADDTWYPDKLEEVVRVIHASDRLADVIWHDENLVINGKKTKTLHYRMPKPPVYEDMIINGNCLSTSATSVKTSLLKETKGFARDRINGEEDYDLWMRLAKSGASFHKIDKTLGEFRITGNNFTSNFQPHIEAVARLRRDHLATLKSEGKLSAPEAARLGKRFLQEMHYALARNYAPSDREEAWQHMKKSISLNPWWPKQYAGWLLCLLGR